MRNTKTSILHFDPNIEKIERALRRAAQLARVRTKQHETIPIQGYSSDESEMGDECCITLGDYERLDCWNTMCLTLPPLSFDNNKV